MPDMPATTEFSMNGRFDFSQDAYLPPTDSHVLEAPEVLRLAGQNMQILTRLSRGPATNSELAQISLKYTSRISDLRAAGLVITCERKSGGMTIYTLQQDATTRRLLK